MIPENITLTRDWSFDPTFSKEQYNLSTSNNTHRIFINPVFSSGSDDLEYPMVIDMPKLVGQVLSNLTVTSRPINDPKFPILMSEHQKCRNILLETGEAPELIILIKSAPSNFLRRDAIRLTWGNDLFWGGRPHLLEEEETTMEDNWKGIKVALISTCQEVLGRKKHHRNEWITMETLFWIQEMEHKKTVIDIR
ncbi:unnamed protein product [Schistosoma margrebowiei]|uniref:Uncharacterized protein n=1 Tax=Schistosoma margrebowiei TaxID=48269 RepID=A0A183MYN7_9TREM|nr:unnamed protein product [Schistosoma margrebowiei]